MVRSLSRYCALVSLAFVAGLGFRCAASAAAFDRSAAFVPPALHVGIAGGGHVDLRDPALSFDFSVDIELGPNRPAAGGMVVALGDGSVRFYEPVAGAVLEGHECLVFMLNRLPSGALDPTDPAVAIFGEDPERAGVIFVKLRLKQSFPQTLSFDVPGGLRITRVHGAPSDARPWFRLSYPPQPVTVEGTELTAGFSAWVIARRDHRASGYLALDFPDRQPPVRLEPLFATHVPTTETGPGYIVILLASADAALDIESLAIATVHADAGLPGCDIWDFTSNVDVRRGRSPFHIVFHAEGLVRFAPLPGRHRSPPSAR